MNRHGYQKTKYTLSISIGSYSFTFIDSSVSIATFSKTRGLYRAIFFFDSFSLFFSHEVGLHDIFEGLGINFYLAQIRYNPNRCLAFLSQLQTTSKPFGKALTNPFLRLSGIQSKASHVNSSNYNGSVIGMSLQRSPKKIRKHKYILV